MGIRPGVSLGREDFGGESQKPGRASGERMTGSFLYVVRGDHNMSKIGVTTNPTARLASLRTGSAFPIDYAWLGITPGSGYDIEQEAHRVLEQYRCSGEWFDCPSEMAIAAVMGAAAKLGQPLQTISLDQADLTLKLAASGNGLGDNPPPRALGFGGWMKVAGRTVLYSLLGMIVLIVVSIMFPSAEDGNNPADGFIGFLAVILPFVMAYAAYRDTKSKMN